MNTGIKTCIFQSRSSLHTRRSGIVAFTLIELLIVISIMAVLASMLSVMLAIAQRQGRITNTRATMMKVDQAVRMFKTDMRVYPWQSDLGIPPAEPALWTNNLAKRLAWHPPEPADATASDPDRVAYIRKFQEDLATIEGKFRFVNGANVPPSGDSSEGTHAFRYESGQTNLLLAPGTLAFDVPTINGSWWRNKLIPGLPGSGNDCSTDARALTKMAEEITKQAYMAGQLPTLAPTGIDATLPDDKALFPNEDERFPTIYFPGTSIPYRYLPYNKSGYFGNDARGPVLATATAKAEGWRGEYLTDAIRRDGTGGDHVDVDATGTALLDAWGRPFIYVSSVRPGVRGGVQALTSTIFPIVIEQRYNMGPQGRTTTSSLTSDIRTTAAPSQVYEFELWSAGPDGFFAATRSDPVNRDNIAVVKYLRELQ